MPGDIVPRWSSSTNPSAWVDHNPEQRESPGTSWNYSTVVNAKRRKDEERCSSIDGYLEHFEKFLEIILPLPLRVLFQDSRTHPSTRKCLGARCLSSIVLPVGDIIEMFRERGKVGRIFFAFLDGHVQDLRQLNTKEQFRIEQSQLFTDVHWLEIKKGGTFGRYGISNQNDVLGCWIRIRLDFGEPFQRLASE